MRLSAVVVATVVSLSVPAGAEQRIVGVLEQSWFYADGKMEASDDHFENTYTLSRDQLVRTQVRNLKTGEVTSDQTVYLIRSELMSHPAALPKPSSVPGKSGQGSLPPVIRAIGNPGGDALEIVVVGADFIQSCKSTSDYFVISRFRRVK